MTDTAAVVRAWVVALSVSALVALWIVLARTPFPMAGGAVEPTSSGTMTISTDPRVAALQRREAALRTRAVQVRRESAQRWRAYREALGLRQAAISQARQMPSYSYQAAPAAAPAAPAVTETRSS